MALSKIVENSISDGAVAAAKLKDFAAAVDLNGVELILDADQDTSITADTDDRIDFKIANVEHFSFSNSSGDTVVKPMVDGKDIVFQQYDGNKILEINDGNFVGVGGNSAGAGEIRIYEDTDNGNHYTGFKAGNNTASVAYVLPTADGSSGNSLQTDGSGTLSWAASGAITTYSNSTNNRVITSVDSSSVNSEANLTFDGSTLAVTGAVTVSTNLDVDGTANLDAVDIDGAVQLDATLTVGANDQGYDVILYGDTASANLTWDTSADDLIFNGAAGLIVPDGQLTLGSTAVTSTAAELNLLDGVSGLVQADFTKLAAVDATAAELNIVDGGTSATSTTVADADRVVMNDNGTMVQVAVTDLAAYFDDEITAMPNLTSVGTLTALTVDDVAVDGKVITMTGSASDTAVFTAGTNGTLDITTTDAAAAAANITITADGTAELAGTTVTLNSGGDIVLDADGADVLLKDGGTTFATHTYASGDYVITTGVQDKDFVIKGDDGGSTITPFTLDMSAAGALFLTGGLIDLKNAGSVSEIKFYCESSNAHAQSLVGAPHSESATNTLTLPGTGGDARLVSRSSTDTLTNKTLTTPVIAEIDSGSTITLDATTDIILDADGGDIFFKDGGTTIGEFTNSSSDFVIKSSVSDKDILLKGNDGGSEITALTLDMSAAGEATFNGAVYSSGKFGLNDGDYINHVDNTRKEFVVNGNEEMRLEADGDLHVDNDIIAFSSTISDERLKENLQPIEDALSKVGQLRGMTFTYTPDGKESAGLIAQDVEKVLPSAVSEKQLPLKQDDGNEYKILQYDQTIGLLVEAIKELTAKVEELEKK